ncbi:MAG TPA: aminopeptidase P family protein [Gemmatimonadales bacterium]
MPTSATVGSDSRLAARRETLIRRLDERGLDGLIVTHLPNIRYLTGFTGSAALLLVLPAETVLLTDFRYRTQAADEVGDTARTEIVSSDIWQRLAKVTGEFAGVRTLGFEADHVTVSDLERWHADGSAIQRRPTKGLVEELRVRKDAGEIGAVRAAAALCLNALGATLETVRVGQTERQIAARLESELRERGSEWHPFQTIVASGPRSALPHARTSSRVVEAGDWLLLDFGAQVDGYCADVTRTVVVGAAATDRQRAAYGVVHEAQQVALKRLASGMSGKAADALARDVIVDRGFGDAFGHSLGHGLGLEVHEEPRLSRTNDAALPERSVVTVEPGIYVPGWGGVRLEDDVLLTPDGAVLLTDGNNELEELG